MVLIYFGDEEFTIPYVIDKTPNSPAGHKLPTQADKNVSIIDINGEELITAQGVLGEINYHKIHMENTRLKSVYSEGIATRGQILNIFVPDLIKSDLRFHILKFFYKRNVPPQRTLVKL